MVLAKLLAVGAGAEGAWDADELALLLRQQLGLTVSSLGYPGGAPPQEVFEPTCTIGDALADDRPHLGALQRIKEHAKSLRLAVGAAAQAPGGGPPEVASVLYYAAILAARVKLGTRISTLDDATLQQGARWCLKQRWVDEPRRALFERAAAGLDSVA